MRNIFLALILISVPLYADDSLDTLMSKLQNKYESLESFKANFTQSYRSARFSDRIMEQGVAYFQKGGLMRWEYNKPEEKIFVSDGTHYFYYVVKDKQVLKALIEENTAQHTPALFLAGRGNFLKDFHAEWADPRPGSHLVKLIPLQPQAEWKHMIVNVDPVTGLILQLIVVDQYDNRTEFSFGQIQENLKIPRQFFAFQPPPGADIIYQQNETE